MAKEKLKKFVKDHKEGIIIGTISAIGSGIIGFAMVKTMMFAGAKDLATNKESYIDLFESLGIADSN